MRVAFTLLLAALLFPGGRAEARKRCPEARVQQLAAIIANSRGDVMLVIAHIRERLTTEDVACWAATGDKHMMMELAARLEHGDGIARDVERAEDLYENAAAFKSGNIAIYVPGVAGQPGRVMLHRIGPDVPGLTEASFRRALMHIEGRAAKPSLRKGMKILERLAEAGYQPARDRLATLTKT